MIYLVVSTIGEVGMTYSTANLEQAIFDFNRNYCDVFAFRDTDVYRLQDISFNGDLDWVVVENRRSMPPS